MEQPMNADYSDLLAAVDFYRAESEYWKAIATNRGDWCLVLPPEPPLGTGFRGHNDGVVKWFRRVDGWVCRVTNCKRCPVDWVEVSNHLSPNWRRELPGEPVIGRQAIHYDGDLIIDNSVGDHRDNYKPLPPSGSLLSNGELDPDGVMTSPYGELNPEGFVDTFYRRSLIS
jgi:hypothetical protein